jgi:hypothetical protein
MIPCPLCPPGAWALLLQGRKSSFARCPAGHRLYADGETVDEIAQRLGHDSSRILTLGPDGLPLSGPGGAGGEPLEEEEWI